MKAQKLSMLGLLTFVWFTGAAGAGVLSFDDIEYWIGEGSNEAALVIDWDDSLEPVSMIWGYRWDGTATGEDMFFAVSETDSRFGGVGTSNWGTVENPDYFVDSIGYDLTGDSSNDHYQEGWWDSDTYTGEWWSYHTYDEDTNPWAAGQTWESPSNGMSGRQLSNGSWDGWYFTDGSGGSPSSPTAAAIPEPSTFIMVILGTLILYWRRR